MIFVTVGGQMPFDRLLRWVDEWAAACDRADVLAQTGDTSFRPECMSVRGFLPPVEFRAALESAEFIIGHAGMGTILTALELGKPLLVVPRRASLGETRNDHQVATATYFEREGMVLAAFEHEQFPEKLAKLEAGGPGVRIAEHCPRPLLERVRDYALSGKPGAPARGSRIRLGPGARTGTR